MAKKAKRRGRPPGSKNKKCIGKSVATMDIAQLRAHIEVLQGTLAKKVSEQRAYFEDQLSQLGGYVVKEDFGGCESRHADGKAASEPRRSRSIRARKTNR